ncbi:hypothetical protein [Rufibacter latericius]|uniref:Peptidase M15B domain-containing protein n=1 Tax=Rufibacter latericius TaxID=2487040 RepID=A0A3M9N032_9BACT|nr:hypothetical protein [Rufibacter latericius]RNI30503.1 hypothetical protein EFB08_04385 [Rufibacter latericius]
MMPLLNKLFRKKKLLTVSLLLSGGGLLSLDFSGPEKKSAATLPLPTSPLISFTSSTSNPVKINQGKSLFEQNLPPLFPHPEPEDWVSLRILKDHGAVFVAQGSVIPPSIIFANADHCLNWQAKVSTRREKIGGIPIELQTEAMNALLAARREAASKNLRITPRGKLAARRSYHDTEKIWSRRVIPGLAYWQRRGKLDAQEADRIRMLAPAGQVKEVLLLEAQGLYFSKDFSKSVLYSGSAPGASQHISMLALDINEYNQAGVRAILARHGWFQTVVSDLPHFTYLGTTQSELPALGLKKTVKQGRIYWTPA